MQHLLVRFDTKWQLVCILLVGVLIYIIPVFFYPVSDPGESYYIASGLEMLNNNEFLVPVLNNQIYFSKPVLSYWLVEIAFKVFGINEWAGRIPFALVAIVNSFIVYIFVRLIYTQKAAWWAALITLAAPMLVLNTKLSPIDIVFGVSLNLALYTFILSINTFKTKFYWIFIYLGLAVACLTKGPAALVLLVMPLILALCVLQTKKLTLIKWFKRLHLIQGLLIFLALVLPWFVLITLKTKGLFIKVFLLYENYGRFLGRTNMSKTKIWYFIPVILYSLFPWIFGLPFIVLKKMPNLPYHKYLSNIFLLLFSLTTFLIFSISKTKLDTYILPMICPLAILIVTGIENRLTGVNKYVKVLLWLFILVQAMLAIVCQVLVVYYNDLILFVKLLLFIVSLILAYLTFKNIKAYQRQNYNQVFNLTVFSVVFFEAMLITPFLNKYINNKQASLKQLAIYLKKQNDPAVFFQGFKPSVQFYYGKPINTFFHGENLTQNLSFKNKYLILCRRTNCQKRFR